ncbi:MAG: hypothetical protein D5R97_05565 [Candidatus Syntrophonatronum acetioxidans]|uniref:HTH luxR-type domain-containing protein n=1 Tax=Candidatus Syntrophonatronum acetioxidans TaxID=1795816 RepID=A0A424YE88_9FIRM|nr:MAG: hypothetical protein D5R97_05565 [Candidatus Syntrophonatronum acetioxidans]
MDVEGNILHVKVNIPPLNPSSLQRSSLLEGLEKDLAVKEGFGRQLTLLSAPAGFGKTTLARSWLRGKEARSAWYSLDEGDNQRERFWLYLVSALQRVEADLGKGTLEMLRSTVLERESNVNSDSLLVPLLNELFALKEPLYLLLDDYHSINNTRIHQDMVFLIENLPPLVHLVVTTRSEPPWPLTRWRARGKMTEVRQKDLRFTREEAGLLFAGVKGLHLRDSQVEALHRKTEGWITGLQLAAISLSGNPDAENFINSFTGSHRHVFLYLSEEVFQRQPEGVREFLLQTSIFKRFSAPLCDFVTGREDSAALLAELDRKNLFLVALDEEGRWYRYHPLFADLLSHQLKKIHPGLERNLHGKAAQWLLEKGEPGEAIRHALLAENSSMAADILKGNLEEVVVKEGSSLVQECLNSFSPDLLRAYPDLAIHKAWFHLIHKGGEEAKEIIQLAEAMDTENPFEKEARDRVFSGKLAVVKAYYHIFAHNFPRAQEEAGKALELLPPDNYYWRSKVGVILGDSRLFSGNPKEAYPYYLGAYQENQAYGNTYLTLSTGFKVATSLYYRGKLGEAEQMTRELLVMAKDKGLSRLSRTGLLWTLLGDYHRERGNMEEAKRCLERGLHLSEGEKPAHGWNYLYKIAYFYSNEQYHQALVAGKQLEKIHREVVLPSFIILPLTAWKALLYLKVGSPAKAGEVLARAGIREGGEIQGGQERCYLALAQLMAVSNQGRYTQGEELLDSLEEMALRGQNKRIQIEVLLAKARLAQQGREEGRAEAELKKALQAGCGAGYFQVYLDEKMDLSSLYARLRGDESPVLFKATPGLAEFAHRIYNLLPAAQEQESPDSSDERAPIHKERKTEGGRNNEVLGVVKPHYQELIEDLSPREMEILELFSQGLSNKEIARKIYLSPGTVKWHASNIYGKLGVKGKLQAVALARQMKLIS